MKNILKLSVLTLLLSINLFARSLDDIKASGEIIITVYENFHHIHLLKMMSQKVLILI